jgi:hypothetical protein
VKKCRGRADPRPDQQNRIVRFELREVHPAHHDASVMRFARQPAATLEEMTLYQVPINARDTANLREIRISDVDKPLRVAIAGVKREVSLMPVVVVPRQGFTSGWYWIGERLTGVVVGKGLRRRPFSIARSRRR